MLVLTLASGCARSYVLTLNNGSRIVSAGKPKLAGGHYIYQDVRGEKFSVPASRVREIAPTSMAQDDFSTGDRPGFLPK